MSLRHHDPGGHGAFLSSGVFTGLVSGAPEVVEADDAADRASRILCDDRTVEVQIRVLLRDGNKERCPVDPDMTVNGD